MRTLRKTGRCAQAAREIQKYNLTLLGMCEVRWAGHKETKLQTRDVALFRQKRKKRHEADVGLLLSKKATKSLLEWDSVSDASSQHA